MYKLNDQSPHTPHVCNKISVCPVNHLNDETVAFKTSRLKHLEKDPPI